MFSNLATKMALKKVGLSSSTFDFSSPAPAPEPKKLSKSNPNGSVPGLDETEGTASSWPAWMSVKNLPLTVQPWLAPVPPPVPVAAECPKVGDLAPLDRDRKLAFGGGKKVLVVFLRCVGCAFAQKTFLALRALANKHAQTLTCIAVSHSSAAATEKWVSLMGGAWNVQVVIDEDRAIYAAWGLGLGSVWYVLNPTTYAQGWREKGWLGNNVATAIQRTGTFGAGKNALDQAAADRKKAMSAAAAAPGPDGQMSPDAAQDAGPTTVMGNKWQQAGAWAVNERGTVMWGGKALTADDIMDLEAGAKALGL